MAKLTKRQKMGVGGVITALIATLVAVVKARAAPPEVCTPTETACSVDLGLPGKDLYECSPECKWVLIEANSPSCGWVPGDAEFTVADLIIEPATVNVGEPVAISVLVTNIGGERGTKRVTLEVI